MRVQIIKTAYLIFFLPFCLVHAKNPPFQGARALLQANPALATGFNHYQQTTKGKLIVNLDNNRGLQDISPLKGMAIHHLAINNTRVQDLSPLKGMPLNSLGLWRCPVSDISALKDMPLTSLTLNATRVKDISVLERKDLDWLDLSFTRIDDISALKDMPLKRIKLEGCRQLRDIRVLASCKELEGILLPPNPGDISFLKSMPNLKFIGTNWREYNMKKENFWVRYGERFTAKEAAETAKTDKGNEASSSLAGFPKPKWNKAPVHNSRSEESRDGLTHKPGNVKTPTGN